jgi:MFS superfamily sulfate permease-like transporter
MRLPVFSWLPTYDRRFLRGDVIAGVSPVVGLYAAPAAIEALEPPGNFPTTRLG